MAKTHEGEGRLEIFTVYRNPSDYPGRFVVRRFRIAGGIARADVEPWSVDDTIFEARKAIPEGLTWMSRSDRDDPVIAEVWL